MATTLAASAYFLTCCRPIHNSFCFLVEKPKLINFYQYPLEYFLKHPLSECLYNHEHLIDHSLNNFNKCTDGRAWSLDDGQKRQHFHDLICGRIPHCTSIDTGQRRVPKEEKKPKIQEDEENLSLIGLEPEGVPEEFSPKENLPETEDEKLVTTSSEDSGKLGAAPSVKSIKSEKLEPVPSAKSLKSENLEYKPSEKSVKFEIPEYDQKDVVVGFTDELIEKLDRNLRSLESTFDKFQKKNRDFIQNLVECLDFENQKQKALEDDYNQMKQENEALKTQNDYLKMVNNKQLDLFKNELDKGISENKVIYKRKIHWMERQLQNDKNELQMYKQTEKKYMEVVEQDNEQIEKLNSKIEDLKNKEVQLVRNYLQLLKFLENVKNILSGADPKEIPQLKSLNTITDSEGENLPDVKRVLRDALNNGMKTLNVRDLSILHDAIEGLDNTLCHQSNKCTKSPTADSSFPDFSTMSIHRLVIEHSREEMPKYLQGYETSSDQSIDRVPTRQRPEDRRVHFD